MKLQDFRNQYPQYQDIPDGELAYLIWDKSYKDKFPMGLFADEIDLPQASFKDMTDSAKKYGYRPSEITFAEDYVPPLARPIAFLRGATMGLGENVSAAVGAGMQQLSGTDNTFGEGFNDYLNLQRDMLQQYQAERPKEAFAVEMAGAVALALASGGITTPVAAGRAPSVARAAATAGGMGGVYGAATGEGGIQERAQSAVESAIPSALFGGGTQLLFNIASPAIRGVFTRMDQSARNPTIDTLQAAKNRAYQAVSDAGVVVDEDATAGIYNASQRIARLRDYNPEVDKFTKASLDLLETQADRRLTIPQLDRVRQSLWDRYKQSGYSEPAIRDMIDQIDRTIQTLPGDTGLIRAARLANSRFKKGEVISEAFDRAERSATAAGTGGNVVNRYKQVINNILNDKKQTRYFDDTEILSMRDFVDFTPTEQFMRVVGKLDPTSNGLMTALNVAAVMAEPTMAAASMAGAGARRAAEGMAKEKGEALFQQLATGVAPQFSRARPPSGLGPVVLSEYEREQRKLTGGR
jgi:hypothetical protein